MADANTQLVVIMMLCLSCGRKLDEKKAPIVANDEPFSFFLVVSVAELKGI